MKTNLLSIAFLCLFAVAAHAQSKRRPSANLFYLHGFGQAPKADLFQQSDLKRFHPNQIEATAWLLDTMIQYDPINQLLNRVMYDYNPIGMVKEIFNQKWLNSAWVNNYRFTQQINSDNVVLGSRFEIWVNNTWKNSSQTTIQTGGAPGVILEFTQFSWQNNGWVPTSKTIYYGADESHRDSIIGLDYENGIFEKSTRVIETREALANGRKEINTHYNWNLGAWLPAFRYTSTFDTVNHTEVYLAEQYESGAWALSYDKYFEFNALGKTTMVVDRTWTGTQWLNTNKTTTTYLDEQFPLVTIEFGWFVSSWVQNLRTTRTYDTDKNLIRCDYDGFTGAWEPWLSQQYTYDGNGNSIEGTTVDYNEAGGIGPSFEARSKERTWPAAGSRFTATFRSLDINGVKKPITTRGLFYPNPCNGTVQLTSTKPWKELTITDLAGKSILRKSIREMNEQIAIPGIPKGIYQFSLSGERDKVTERVVVE